MIDEKKSDPLKQLFVDKAMQELKKAGERIFLQFSGQTPLAAEEITRRLDEFVKNMTGQYPRSPSTVAKVNDDGSITVTMNLRDIPGYQPTISDYVQDWTRRAKEGLKDFQIASSDAQRWTKDDWSIAFVHYGGELSKQLSATATDPKMQEEAEDHFAMFRSIAEACGHAIECGGLSVGEGPVTLNLTFDYEGYKKKDQTT